MTDHTTSSDTSTASFERTESPPPDGGPERRRFLHLLVGLGVGLPVLVEVSTFVGLLGRWLSGEERDSATGSEGARKTVSSVSVGDELLPETPQREILEEGRVIVDDGDWTLTLAVSVRNDGDAPYALTLGAVTTGTGRRVEGRGERTVVAVDESTTVVGRWTLPSGETPRQVRVGHERGDETAWTAVTLGKIPVLRR